MTLRKDRGAIRSRMSAMNVATKGSVTGAPAPERGDPTTVGPNLPVVPDNAQFHEKNFAGIGSNEKGASLAAKGLRDRGARVEDVAPLSGHLGQNFAQTSAESGHGPVLRGSHNPVRGSGNKTKITDLSAAQKD
jgi:hypothetical protein